MKAPSTHRRLAQVLPRNPTRFLIIQALGSAGGRVMHKHRNHANEITVLYVEDDALTRKSVSGRMTRRGIRVVSAESGEAALELVKREPLLSVFLIDIELPGIDGFETCARLRKQFPDVPVVICSGQLTAAARERLKQLEVRESSLLSKPCPFNQLLAAVHTAINTDHAEKLSRASGS